jgi:hypothetical protein
VSEIINMGDYDSYTSFSFCRTLQMQGQSASVSFEFSSIDENTESEVLLEDRDYKHIHRKEFSTLSKISTSLTRIDNNHRNNRGYLFNLKLSVILRNSVDQVFSKSTGIIGNLEALVNSSEMSDFKFVVGAKVFPVHKTIIGGESLNRESNQKLSMLLISAQSRL